jgi:hypothetical protein
MANENKKPAKRGRPKKVKSEPLMTAQGSAVDPTSRRRNLAGNIERTDRFKNIDDGLIPFRTSSGHGKTNLSIRHAVILCQKCYYNFSIFRNIIDTMTEFSVSNLYFRGGNKNSRDFFDALFKKINLWDFQDKFFREYYRSGNVFTYRYDAKLSKSDVKNVTQVYGKSELPKLPTKEMFIPSRYTILNPADIQLHGSLNFSEGKYYKVLSDYELERVRNPKSDEDLEIYNSLDEETKKLIKRKAAVTSLSLPLSSEKLLAVFYKKQDYEPFAVPFGYPVLEDINFKYEMKKMDMAIARTMQQAILMVTMGEEPEKGGINQENLKKMQALFQNESIGRVLIADYTTKAEFVIPQIGQLLDSRKYEVINNDINIGLNNIFVGGEKFANQSAKVEVFISRLTQGRRAFIYQFLLPEIKRIARSLGFRSFPTPYFEDFELKTNSEILRVYTRLVELGVLTPEEGIKALETNRLPSKEESLESQEEFRGLKDKGLYEPIAGGPNTQMELADKQGDVQIELQEKNIKSQEKLDRKKTKEGIQDPTGPPSPKGVRPNKKPSKESGRPSGTKDAPYKSNRKITPIGGKEGYSMAKVKELFILSQSLEIEVSKVLREKHKVKRLTNQQKEISREISNIVMANEEPELWMNNAKEYCDKPIDKNKERVSKVNDVACEHGVDMESASILYASKEQTEN